MTKYLLRVIRWLPAVAAVYVAVVASTSVTHAQGTWAPKAPVSCPSGTRCPTEGMAVGGIGQMIIAAYGITPSGETNLTRLYNIGSNSWSLGAAAPAPPREELAYGEITHGGLVYAIGGGSEDTLMVSNQVEVYDPVANTWTTKAPMPTPRSGAAAAVIGDSAIYVIGGRTRTLDPCIGTALSVVERYDIDTNSWTTVAPLPSPRSDLAAVERGGKIFVFGGCSSLASFTNEVDMYNPKTDTWTVRAPMPTTRASLAAGHSGESVYVIGGVNATLSTVGVNEAYDIESNSWSTAAPMPTPRGEAGVYSHSGKIYVVGGSTTSGFSGATETDANEVFTPCHEAEGSGSVRGKGDDASFSMRHHECEGGGDSETVDDSGAGHHFQSTLEMSATFDDAIVTIVGLGTDNGLPVAFTLVAVDSLLAAPGKFSIVLSNGYSVSGNLLSGSVTIK